MDPEIKAEISYNVGEESEMSANANLSVQVDTLDEENNSVSKETPAPASTVVGSGSSLIQGEDTITEGANLVTKSSSETGKGRRSLSRSNNHSSKKKAKVDWTPELHRQFVQAVEQLGVDKAVPSKILEIMGIDCLTRHNVASHLQKYRSNRKHMLAREAEAAKWSRRRQMCGTSARTGKGNADSWTVPITGFPPVSPMPHIRPLHVWGHPSADQSLTYMWPCHVASPSPPAWAHPPYHHHPQPQLPPNDPYFWYRHHQEVPAPGMPCFPPHFPPTRFATHPPSIGVPMGSNRQTLSEPSLDSHLLWKERIDAVIGEVLSRPWLPLPLGLKPPAVDSVVMELQRQGISKIPPPTCV